MTGETEPLRAALEHARAAHPKLAALLNRQGRILAAQYAARAELPPLESAGDLTRLAVGKPALTFDDLGIDDELFSRLWLEVDAIMRQHDEDLPRASNPVAAIETRREWFNAGSVQDEYADSLLAAALTPFLWRAADSVLPHVDQETWKRSVCPVCGDAPDLAYFDADGARHLLCARCDAMWLFQRFACPYCGNDDHQRLAYYPSDDQVYRLYVCDQCRRYLKTIDLRQARHRVVWGVERVATAQMDAAAIQQGYRDLTWKTANAI